MARWLTSNINRWPATVYDAGCGNGELLRLLDESGRRFLLCGSDIEPGHVEVARRRANLRRAFIRVGAADEVLPTLPPDVITAIGWLHNDWPSLFATGIPARPADPMYLRRTLTAFNRLLPDGGLLISDKLDPRAEPEFNACGFGVLEVVRDDATGDTFYVCRKVKTVVS